VDGDGNYVRVQVLTNAGAPDRDKQLAAVRELTDIVAASAGDPSLVDRTWVQLIEAPDGGWGLNGHARTQARRPRPDRRTVFRQGDRGLTNDLGYREGE
jgi:phenylpyruvate tautomerase PptA (4-oxalocrotonate tautomerase family)